MDVPAAAVVIVIAIIFGRLPSMDAAELQVNGGQTQGFKGKPEPKSQTELSTSFFHGEFSQAENPGHNKGEAYVGACCGPVGGKGALSDFGAPLPT